MNAINTGVDGIYLATAAMFCLLIYILWDRVIGSSGGGRPCRLMSMAFALVPASALFVAASLILRVRITQGHWALSGGRWAVDGEPAELVYSTAGSYGFDSHYLLAQVIVVIAFSSIVVCGPFFVAYLKKVRHAGFPVILYGASWSILVLLRILDPGSQIQWLLPV